MNFDVDVWSVRRISRRGLWLVTTGNAVDLGLLFLRYQEFYESPNKDFVGRTFELAEYLRWACTKDPKERQFTYFENFEGFNVPGATLDAALKRRWRDRNRFDDAMAEIASRIRRQDKRYYLIGATHRNAAVIDHEIAHGLFYLVPEYREAAELLLNKLGVVRWELMDLIRQEGYGDPVLVDEAQAYMATGLTDEMFHLDPKRVPFMQLFAKWRAREIVNC